MAVAFKPETMPVNQTSIPPSDIIVPEELARRLQVTVSWVYEKCRKGGKHGKPLPVLRCGRYLRFSWVEVCEWLRSNQTP